MTVVRKEEVIDSWSVLIGGGQGSAEEIFTNMDTSLLIITETKAPNVKDVSWYLTHRPASGRK